VHVFDPSLPKCTLNKLLCVSSSSVIHVRISGKWTNIHAAKKKEKENSTCGGVRQPPSIVLRRRPSHIGRKNP
jgi:hypothetical protein